MENTSTQTDRYARWSFDRLRMIQPQVRTTGLWRKDYLHFIVCPEILPDTKANDGSTIWEWFRGNKAMTSPVQLAASPPPDAVQVPDRTLKEVIELSGTPRTSRDVYSDLLLGLPRSFPQFTIKETFPAGKLADAIITVARALSKEEMLSFSSLFDSFQLPLTYRFEVAQTPLPQPPGFRHHGHQGDMTLIPSQSLARLPVSRSLLRLWEEDEDRWQSDRHDIFTAKVDKQDLIPDGWKEKDARCLINASVFPPQNICNYLSIYQKVTLVAPIASAAAEVYAALNVTEADLAELVEMGRVQILLPQSLDRYYLPFIEMVAERAPNNIILSRKLAGITVCDARQRIPLLYPPFGIAERYELLQALRGVLIELDGTPFRSILEALINELGRIWLGSEELVHYRGAMGTGSAGIAPLVSALFKLAQGRDLGVEFYSASAGVEWAGALGAFLYPNVSGDGYSEEGHSEILAGFYTGMPRQGVPNFVQNSATAIEELLAINKDVPPVAFAKAFGSGDIDRFRKLIRQLVEQNHDPVELQAAVNSFNKEIQSYESRVDRIAKWNIRGLVSGLARASAVSSAGKYIPIGDWIIQQLSRALNDRRHSNPVIGSVLDTMSAITTGKHVDAVLTCRMKRGVTSLGGRP